MKYSKFYRYFQELPVGADFMCNGTAYHKQSSRTAILVENGRLFYFGMLETCYPAID